MIIDFVCLEFEDHIESESDLEALINGNPPELAKEPVDERRMTIEVEEISRIQESIYNKKKWTDVFLKDGYVLVADIDYLGFKIKWLEAKGILAQQTFEDLESALDENIKIRYYLN